MINREARKAALSAALGVNEMEPCIIHAVHNIPYTLAYRMGREHEKGAIVELDWWLHERRKYERRQIVVSRERGTQFRRQLMSQL